MLNISIASRRSTPDKLQRLYPHASIIDVTSRGPEPWVRFSPFYPHGNIPVPFCAGMTATSVEGIWQALKVFKTCDIDKTKLAVATMRGIKRTSRSLGKVLGHRAGLDGDRLLGYLEARKKIYLPSYLWVLENCLKTEIGKLHEIASAGPLILLDYETNTDLNNLTSPLSHAGLIKRYLMHDWPGTCENL